MKNRILAAIMASSLVLLTGCTSIARGLYNFAKEDEVFDYVFDSEDSLERTTYSFEVAEKEGEKPKLEIISESSGITLTAGDSSDIEISYSDIVYSVDVVSIDGKTTITVGDIPNTEKHRRNNNGVLIELPQRVWAEVKTDLESCAFELKGDMQVESYLLQAESSAVSIELPNGFEGSCDVNFESGATDFAFGADFKGNAKLTLSSGVANISSTDNYKNCNVAVKYESGSAAVPIDGFSKSGDTYTYKNGTEQGMIVILADSSLISVE